MMTVMKLDPIKFEPTVGERVETEHINKTATFCLLINSVYFNSQKVQKYLRTGGNKQIIPTTHHSTLHVDRKELK